MSYPHVPKIPSSTLRLRTSAFHFVFGLVVAMLGSYGIEYTTRIWPILLIVIGTYSMAAAVLDGWLNTET